MLEMMLMTLKNDRLLPQPTGQITFNVGGAQVFTVPADVTRVSVACLGAALLKLPLPFPYTPYQAGGAIVYMNDIPVTPGQKIDINVGIPGYVNNSTDYNHSGFSRFQSMAAGYYNLMRIPVGAVGWAGGRGGYTNRSGLLWTGGSAARLTASGAWGTETGSSSYNTVVKPGGWDADLTVYTGPSTAQLPNAYGRGGDLRGGNDFLQQPTGGIVRIIWGNNRGFPNRDIGNMEEKTLDEVLAGK